jgi:hypothetical protein
MMGCIVQPRTEIKIHIKTGRTWEDNIKIDLEETAHARVHGIRQVQARTQERAAVVWTR